eukprot:TRINITY_DN10861_c0_g1_i1.p1 TRINITY_DN10861_c0_g1~~TRINITY_DN10861_c0_g1_i1.p1  ORF type:complete len:267 (-),score=14.63 TRINITY_DN10861_c0_g1_i1:113-913(-)
MFVNYLLTIVYHAITGESVDDFHFKRGVTPLSTNVELITSCITYLVVIFGGQALMKNRKPFELTTLSRIHNLFLTIISLVLLLLFTELVAPRWWNFGFHNAICHADSYSNRMEFLYYVNYLIKFYELIDTIFLVLKKKNIEFLHYYHHSATIVLCYTQLVGRSAVSWVCVVLNLIVHVAMYYYYFLSTFGIQIWWKKYLTILQIVQFVIDLVIIYMCLVLYGLDAWGVIVLPCHGTLAAGIWGAVILSSYLLLFVQFYFKTYKKTS